MITLTAHLERAVWMQELQPELATYVVDRAHEKHVAAGEYVFMAGMQPTCWIGVIEGLLLMCRNARSGHITALTSVSAGGWTGEASLLFQEHRRFDLLAIRRSRLACIPRPVVMRLYRESIEFNHYLMKKLAARMGRMALLVASDRLLSPTTRVARCIATLVADQNHRRESAHLVLTQSELGALTGLSRQHVSKALHALQAANTISIERRAVRLVDFEKLVSVGNTW